MKTEILKLDPQNPDKALLKRAAQIIDKGGLVAFPTETVYGLAADYLNKEALDRLYRIKKRPKEKPFTVHISGFADIDKLSCETDDFSKKLIEKFWPGPLTLIFKTKSGERIGLRMPRNKIALEFISFCKNPIVAPSANISGNKPPHTAGDVLKDLDEEIDLVLDGGKTEVGIESTVVDVSVSPCSVIRKGAISNRTIADICSRDVGKR